MPDLIKDMLPTYNRWRTEKEAAFEALPKFKRPVFFDIAEDLDQVQQILSITGPRRIGKSTLLKQLIHHLLNKGFAPERLIYYSFDDPALLLGKDTAHHLFEEIMQDAEKSKNDGITYLFLDEIQKFSGWELYLKKYYDLKFPVRIIISGSASSPIFKKSRESLLGRVKEYHLSPFSFREYVLYKFFDQKKTTFFEEAEQCHENGNRLISLVNRAPDFDEKNPVYISPPSPVLQYELDQLLNQYLLDGGFPEVWSFNSWEQRQEYLVQNQIDKVIFEDLLIAAEFRKPQLLRRFYISLLERPGAEVTVTGIASETEVKASQIEKYLPLLELTNLVFPLYRFKNNTVGLRKGRMKIYLADLALRNAVLRIEENILQDEQMLGLYAENLVFLALQKWKGKIHLDYYKEKFEIDFIVQVGPKIYLPIEVKYRNTISKEDLYGVQKFMTRFTSYMPIIVTKKWDLCGIKDSIAYIPLSYFLLMID